MLAPDPTGLDIAYDEIKDAYDRLRDQEARLNTQATFIIGAASIAIGPVTGILGSVATARAAQRSLVHAGVAIDAVLYVVVIFYAWRAYVVDAVRDFDTTDFMAYARWPECDTKEDVNRARLKLYHQSAYKLGRKRIVASVAAGALLAEILWLAIILVVVATAS